MSMIDTMTGNFNILIVDDNPANVKLASIIIQKAGYNTASAPDGETALELTKKKSYDLILLDIMMPGIDGREVCQRLQDDPARKNIPIIFLTAISESADIAKGLKLGAVDYVTKPIDSLVLIARVNTHLELSHKRKQLEQQVINDELTGLLNRRGFLKSLKEHLKFHKRKKQTAAILFIDLDQFKNINDSMGHDAGDELLKKVSDILNKSVRETDIVARFGGDEFVIGLLDISAPEDAANISNKIIDEISKPFVINQIEVFIGASIGVTFYPNDTELLTDLLKNGDNAMYQAKKTGKNRYVFYEKKMEEKAKRILFLNTSLHNALKNNEFKLLYQPQVLSATGEVFGAEVLIRWQNPKQGLIPPSEFIPLAEKNGLIIPIGEYVLNEACRQTKYWHDLGHKKITISVNFSVKQFQQRNIVDVIKRTIKKQRLDPKFLNVEITESLLMVDVKKMIKKLQELKDFGIESSIDDFGTGYSSLKYLQQFPVAHLKIDKAFVDKVVENSTIASAIINLGKNLDLHVIAEGIEDQKQNEKLIELGCHQAQGYLFGKPLMVDDFENLLGSNGRKNEK
ncbi:MAG: EAL domain-containing protein [Deltaproteobacteria bacterium]|jgi:diguanylate cyclase|nr:EAL domain-containing protein [Deltaproteobacteria bacterium]MBT4526460.1 EAL domain-containing protein [Deltaproteobacteria bacterium]